MGGKIQYFVVVVSCIDCFFFYLLSDLFFFSPSKIHYELISKQIVIIYFYKSVLSWCSLFMHLLGFS